MIALVLAALTTSKPLVAFCPLAPSPVNYRQNLSMRVDGRGKMTTPLDARSVARLVDARDGGATIGWLYLDGDGNHYVVLKAWARPDLYIDFGMLGFNRNRPGIPTEPNLQMPFRLPPGIQIESCYEASISTKPRPKLRQAREVVRQVGNVGS